MSSEKIVVFKKSLVDTYNYYIFNTFQLYWKSDFKDDIFQTRLNDNQHHSNSRNFSLIYECYLSDEWSTGRDIIDYYHAWDSMIPIKLERNFLRTQSSLIRKILLWTDRILIAGYIDGFVLHITSCPDHVGHDCLLWHCERPSSLIDTRIAFVTVLNSPLNMKYTQSQLQALTSSRTYIYILKEYSTYVSMHLTIYYYQSIIVSANTQFQMLQLLIFCQFVRYPLFQFFLFYYIQLSIVQMSKNYLKTHWRCLILQIFVCELTFTLTFDLFLFNMEFDLSRGSFSKFFSFPDLNF